MANPATTNNSSVGRDQQVAPVDPSPPAGSANRLLDGESGRHFRTPERTRADVAARVRRLAGGVRPLLRVEWLFVLALAVGAAIRVVAMLGFRPVLWVNDGFEYVGVALRFQAYPIRPSGYSAFLRVLLPFHSLALVAALQHAMGLGVAVLLYSLLRHWRVPRRLAAVACFPELLDIHQVQLEHHVMSDTLFLFLLVAAVTLLAWQHRVSTLFAGLAGLSLALASLTRTVGVPVLILGGLFLLIRWAGWRPLVTYLLLAVLPLGLYAAWFDHEHGSVALTTSDGIFLYSRVMQFADCAIIKPPVTVAMLCDPRPVRARPVSSDYIWHTSPLDHLPGTGGETAIPAQRFTQLRNDRALSFAIDAIVAQPGGLLSTTWRGFIKSFTWTRVPFPSAQDVHADLFSSDPVRVPLSRVFVVGGTAGHDTSTYQNGPADTRLVKPYAGIVMGYQKAVFVPGPVLALLLAIGLAALAAVWRHDRRRWQVLLLWAVAMSMLVLPVLTAQFGNRYVVPAVPFAAAAAALSLVILVPKLSTVRNGGTPDGPDFVLATANPDKAREIADILGPAVHLIPRPSDVEDVEETGETLLDNARLKARALVAATGQPAIADDTGLEVDGLGGQPGVYSARYAGEGATYADNVAKLLTELDGAAADARRARFRTVAVAAWPDGRELVAEGRVEGVVAAEPKGRGGFGYDSVFVPLDGDGRTFAEMTPGEKHALSHRGRAFGQLAMAMGAIPPERGAEQP